MPEVKLQGFVGINSDDEYQMVPQPDTITGENIVIQSTSEGQNASVKPRLGDTYRFEIPPAEISYKKFRIRTDSEYVHLKLTDANGVKLFAEAIGEGPSALEDCANELESLLNDFNQVVTPGTPPSVLFDIDILTDNDGIYVEVSMPLGIVQVSNTVPPVTNAIPNPNATYDFNVLSGDGNDYGIACISDSVTPSMAGPLKVIGSVDYLGDTFVFSCVDDKQPITFSALSVEVIGLSVIVGPIGFPIGYNQPSVTVNCLNHGLSDGDLISIFVPNALFVSGNYTVTVIDANKFQLNGYPYGFSRTTTPDIYYDVLITKNVVALGEIGVFTKNYEGQEVYTRLLRSSELNFRTYHQIDVDAESTLDKIALYFTDGLNLPRVFYYKGDYIEDGAIEHVNSLNTYEYGKINDQLRLVLSSNDLKIRFVEQLQTGGNLSAGNKRYVVRGLSADLTPGFWSDATSIIPVFKARTNGSPRLIKGVDSGTQTEKINVLEISGIPTDIFSFVEIGVIEYLDVGYEVYLLNRIPVGGISTLIYNHNGKELETTPVSSQEFNIDNKSVKTALNLSILDNRLLLSNVEYYNERGLSSILDSVKYDLRHYRIPKQGKEQAVDGLSTGYPANGLNVAEYQLPENVYNYVGYMPNETYYFAARFVFKDGFVSKPVPFVKVKFDTEPESEDGRRTSGLPSYNTIENVSYDSNTGIYNDGDVLVNYIQFSGFNMSALINGVPAYKLIDRIDIMRAEVTEPTVLGCGLAVMSINTGLLSSYNGNSIPIYCPNFFLTGALNGYTSTPFSERGYFTAGLSGYASVRNVVTLYMPDFIFTTKQLSSLSQDSRLIVFGHHQYDAQSDTYIGVQYNPSIAKLGRGGYIHYGGNSGFDGTGFQPVEYEVEEYKFIADAQKDIKFSQSNPVFAFDMDPAAPGEYKFLGGFVLKLKTNIPTELGGEEKGLRYVQIYTPNPNQYSDLDLTKFIYTSSSYYVETSSTENTISVFGGDTFIQRCTLKYGVQTGTVAFAGARPVCVDFYSHNRINVQLRGGEINDVGDGFYPAEFNSYNDWCTVSFPFYDETLYSTHYDARYDAQSKLPFIENLPDDNKQPTSIIYSNTKIRGSVQDSYRNFSYSDVTSLDTTYGPINFMKAMNGELYTIQDRRIQRQFFNTRGVLSTSDGATALIGDGAAFYRDGVTISTMGSKHKWSVVTGRSFGGNDVWYWYDDVNKAIVRFGADGIVPISTRAKIRTKLRSLTDLAKFNYTPADCFGIHGVWNEKLSEVVWVFRLARNYKGVWQRGMSIKQGDVYSMPNEYYSESIEEIPVLYQAIEDIDFSIIPPDNQLSAPFNRIDYGDDSYMKFFSIVFSEAQNRFISVDDFYPKIFMKNEDDVYFPRPLDPVGAVLKKDSGLPLLHYNIGGIGKSVYGAVESVFNIDPNLQKKAVALRVNSELVPAQIEVRSENGQTFMIDSDFQGRLDQWDSPVLNNTPDVAGRKNDTGGIFGKYIRVKFIFAPLQLQRLINMVLKFKPVSRNYNT